MLCIDVCFIQHNPLSFRWVADVSFIWRLVCQKKVSRTGTSNYVPQIPWDVMTCPCMWVHHSCMKWDAFYKGCCTWNVAYPRGDHYWYYYHGSLHLVESLQLIWTFGTYRFHLGIPHLPMSYSYLTMMTGYQDNRPNSGHKARCPVQIIEYCIYF